MQTPELDDSSMAKPTDSESEQVVWRVREREEWGGGGGGGRGGGGGGVGFGGGFWAGKGRRQLICLVCR